MIVRRDRAAIRGGAGLLLVVACIAGPAVAQAAPTPAPAEITPMQTCKEGTSPSASAASTELGNSVSVSGTCFEPYEQATISIFVPGDDTTRQTGSGQVGADGSVSATFDPPTKPGDYSIVIDVGQQQATGLFTVTGEAAEPDPEPEPTDPPTEEPTDPPTEEPTDPPTEEPTDPTDPVDPPTDEPSEPEEPTTPEQPTDPETPTDDPVEPSDPPQTPESPDATDDPTEGPTEDATTAPDEDDSPASPSPSTSASPAPAPAPTTPTTPSPSAEDDLAPTAGTSPTASEQTPSSPAPAAPGPATNDFPAAAPEYTAEQREAASLAVLMTSLFAHGVSNGQVGISPAEAGTPNADGTVGDGAGTGDGSSTEGSGAGDDDGADGSEASDGSGDELAETGASAAGPAVFAVLMLAGGAGLLWHHRRRNS